MNFCLSKNTSRRLGGFTLMEVVITLGIATLFVVGVITFTTITFRQGIFAIGNYTDLNNKSRRTLDIMSRDIRGAASLFDYSYRYVGLNYDDGTRLYYIWDGYNQVTRWTYNSTNGAYWKPVVLMTNCDYLRFNIYQRNPTNTFNFVSATNNWNQTKLIDVSWRCSRSYMGSKLNTESVQTARIVMRN